MFIKNYQTLNKSPQRKVVLDLIEAGLSSIQPEEVVRNGLKLQENIFYIQDQEFNLNTFERIFLIGFGKGAAKISKIIEDILGERLTEGFVIDVKPEDFKKIKGIVGTHPLPSQINLDFTKNVVERFEGKLTEKDLVLVVVCGGGSALFELPKDLSLEELIRENEALVRSGLTIDEMNDERKKLSRVKAGGLARILAPSKILGLVFSDVPGNDISTVASGPTDDPSATNFLMLSNNTALFAMQKKAEELGFTAKIFSDKFQSDAKDAGKLLIDEAKNGEILLAGGETTVHVTGTGSGGRNLEVILNSLPIFMEEDIILASFSSDGWDNCEAAGAIGDSLTIKRAQELGLNPAEFLKDNNSLPFFQKTEDAILTGRLPSNVSDLFITYKR